MNSNSTILEIASPEAAQEQMEIIGVSGQGIKKMSAKFILFYIKIFDIPFGAANILKQEMLALGGDVAVNRFAIDGRIKRCDVILIGSLSKVKRLSTKLVFQNDFCELDKINKLIVSHINERELIWNS